MAAVSVKRSIKRRRDFVPTPTLYCVDNALIRSQFDYCNIVWGNCGTSSGTGCVCLIIAVHPQEKKKFPSQNNSGPLWFKKFCHLSFMPPQNKSRYFAVQTKQVNPLLYRIGLKMTNYKLQGVKTWDTLKCHPSLLPTSERRMTFHTRFGFSLAQATISTSLVW